MFAVEVICIYVCMTNAKYDFRFIAYRSAYFYRAMHYSAKCGLAIACHLGWKSWKQIARTFSPTPSLFVTKGHPPNPRATWETFRENGGGLAKSGHKSGNISETRKDRGKVAMERL